MKSRLSFIIPLLFIHTQTFAQFTIRNTKIDYVIDGDTFVTTINNKKEKVRMKCIDAPELKQTFISFDESRKEIGIEAKEYLKQILSNSNTITLKCNDGRGRYARLTCEVLNENQNSINTLKCNDGRDKYQRLTCEVFDGTNNSTNLQIVKDGYAYAFPSYCFSQVESIKYIGYQYLAKFSQAGLWRYGVWEEPWGWR